MKCIFCKGNKADGHTHHTIEIGGCLAIIKNVPCHICTQCGDISYSIDVGERLEEIIDALKNTATEIAIVQYTNKVA